MSRFVRRGTVSKGSGPIHLDSYALKGIPIRYTPPIFLPELITLPADWKPPVLPSRESLYYGYSVEKMVVEQAKTRAVSIAAEASLQMREIERLREANQLNESRDEESEDSMENSLPVRLPMPRPPIPGNDILKPTPVVAFNNTSQSGSDGDETSQTGSAGNEADGKSKAKVENDALKSLGQLSIREFEGDIDPFEITSLQAINDMEILQTVLQPVSAAPPTNTAGGVLPSSTPSQVASPSFTATTTGQPSSTGLARNSSSSSQLPSLAQPVASSSVVSQQASSPVVATATPSPAVQIPLRSSSSPTVGVASGSSPSNPFLVGPAAVTVPAQLTTVNPFYPPGPPTSVAPPTNSTNPFHATSPPGVGPLPVGLGHAPSAGLPPPTLGPTPSTVPPLQATTFGQLIDIGSSGPQATTSTPPLQQSTVSPSVPLQTTPPVPKPRVLHPLAPISTPPTTAAPDPVPQQRNPVFPSVQPGRFGVPVLPPISGAALSSAPSRQIPSTSASLQPPPYKEKQSPQTQRRDVAPPPPYSAPEQQPSPKERKPKPPRPTSNPAPPPVTPRIYKLPDPTAKLNQEQQSEMKSISGMGFPSPRVARAMLKCDGDRTKVFDFLFLVGQLEEQGYQGDSAETALLACNESPDKALEYLAKVEGYKGMGFSEKAIHEGYGKSKGDWDKALDILIQGR